MFECISKMFQKDALCSCKCKITTLPEVLQKPEHKLSAFLIACSEGNFKVVNQLLHDKQVDPTAYHNEGFRIACANGHYEIAFLLLHDSRVDPTDGLTAFERNDAFKMAAFNNHLKIVKMLLEDGRADPSDDNDFSLRMCSMKGHEEIVQLLLAHPKVNPAARSKWMDNEALRVASQCGHFNIVRMLLSNPKVNPFITFQRKKNLSANKTASLVQSISDAYDLALQNQHNDVVELFQKNTNLKSLPKPKRIRKFELCP